MYVAFEVLTVVLVASTMGLALAHALELPGKMRLSKEQYLTVQPIYYPGFTIGGGVAEAGGIVATLVLLLVTPGGTRQFWLTAGALAALVIMHLIFWVMTQPANRLWLQETDLTGPAKRFFGAERTDRTVGSPAPDWTILRDRWERSHVLRAAAAMVGLILVVTATAL
jgi:hypothetical protein